MDKERINTINFWAKVYTNDVVQHSEQVLSDQRKILSSFVEELASQEAILFVLEHPELTARYHKTVRRVTLALQCLVMKSYISTQKNFKLPPSPSQNLH